MIKSVAVYIPYYQKVTGGEWKCINLNFILCRNVEIVVNHAIERKKLSDKYL